MADETRLYRVYRAAAGNGIPVLPTVAPGENTRGVRLRVHGHAQPRQWLPGESSGSTLKQELDLVARPDLEPALPLVFISSWNEWNEDSAIQPIGGTPTSRDDSPNGQEYTQGYTYGGEGHADLDVVRDFVGEAWGQVVGPMGAPLPHVDVVETAGRVTVSRARTDSDGWYVLPRTPTCNGTITVPSIGRTKQFSCSELTAAQVDFGP